MMKRIFLVTITLTVEADSPVEAIADAEDWMNWGEENASDAVVDWRRDDITEWRKSED